MAPKRQAEAEQSSPSKKHKDSGKASPADLVKALLDETKLSATYATWTWGLASVHVCLLIAIMCLQANRPSMQPLRVQPWTACSLHPHHLTASGAGTVMSLASTSTLGSLMLSSSGAAVSSLFTSSYLSSSQLTNCTD